MLFFTQASFKKRLLIAVLAGVMATLTLPPFCLFPLLIPAFGLLFWLVTQAENTKQRFWLGWCFGLGYFVSGLYWFAYSLLVDAEKFAWMIPFAVLGLPSILAIFYGLATASYGKVKRYLPLQDGLSHALLFATIWLVFDLARGNLFTGFPWNLIALSWAGSLPMMQPLNILGAYGYSWWTVLLALLPAVCWLPQQTKKQKNTALFVCLVMLVVPFVYGSQQLKAPIKYAETTIKLVQPSIPQRMKMNPEQRAEMVKEHVAISQNTPEADLTIWSETAYPFIAESNSPPIKFIASRLLNADQKVITGGVRIAGNKVTNSLNVIESDASISAHYDKIRLVPFGEFIPLRWLLPIESVAQGMQDFSVGAVGQQIKVEGVPAFLPLICYEVIFPEMAASAKDNRPEWILNITNDAWFGNSSGPYQHFYMTRMRAVEQGLPLVRVANNGISAIIDAKGRVLKSLPLNGRGVITHLLPKAEQATWYAKFGDWWMCVIIIAVSLCVIFLRKRNVY